MPLYNHYEKFDVENGLPQSYVTAIDQDKDGYIWLSTLDGLARYDGRQFLTFRPLPNDAASLSTNRIHSIIIDSQNRLWIVHVNGTMDQMNPETFVVKRNALATKKLPFTFRAAGWKFWR